MRRFCEKQDSNPIFSPLNSDPDNKLAFQYANLDLTGLEILNLFREKFCQTRVQSDSFGVSVIDTRLLPQIDQMIDDVNAKLSVSSSGNQVLQRPVNRYIPGDKAIQLPIYGQNTMEREVYYDTFYRHYNLSEDITFEDATSKARAAVDRFKQQPNSLFATQRQTIQQPISVPVLAQRPAAMVTQPQPYFQQTIPIPPLPQSHAAMATPPQPYYFQQQPIPIPAPPQSHGPHMGTATGFTHSAAPFFPAAPMSSLPSTSNSARPGAPGHRTGVYRGTSSRR